MANIRTMAKAVGMGAIALLLVMVMVSAVYGAVTDTGTSNESEDLAVTGGSEQLSIKLGQSVKSHNGVRTSLNDQARLRGSGQIDVSTNASVGGDEWSVCTWSAAAPSVVDNDEARSIIGYETRTIYYDGTTDEYVGYYYDESDRQEYEVRIGAGAEQANQLICLQQDGGTLTLSRNTTTTSQALSTAQTTAAPPSASWNGTVEETRIYDYPLNASQRAEWVGEPVLAVNGSAPSVRLTYDVRPGDTPKTYFAPGSVTLTGDATLTSGFSGPSISRGTDYQWGGIDGATITILSGGKLDQNGEVLYHSYSLSQYGGLINRVMAIGGAALGLLIVGLLIKSASAVAGAFGDGM